MATRTKSKKQPTAECSRQFGIQSSGRKLGLFDRYAKSLAHLSGKSGAFLAATVLILVWAVSGPIFKYSDTWQLVINTTTTIVTFLMVFIIQNTQNRDTEALQLKLDELLRINQAANNSLLDLEELSEEELLEIRSDYLKLAEKARSARKEKQEAN